MKLSAKQIATAGAMLAICLVAQIFKNLSVYITGPIVNAAIIICTLSCGLIVGLILSVITPITALLIAAPPVQVAVPLVIPFIALGNCIIALMTWFFTRKENNNKNLVIGMASGSVLKALFMGLSISYLILPNMLPEKMLPKLKVFQSMFSVTQLTTALIGSVYAFIIWKVIDRTKLAS